MVKKEKTFIEEIVKEFGDDILATSKVEYVIPTSSTALNISTGIGGIPKGRFTHIFGQESSGKTTLALDIAKNTLTYGGKVLYLDVEQTLDGDMATRVLGDLVKDGNWVVILPDSAENAFAISEKAINEGEFDVIILDSVAALSPEKEQEDAFEDAHYALTPRALTKFFRRNAFKVRKAGIAFVLLNQVRANIGDFFKDFEIPGGNALKHYASINISLFPLTSDKNRIKIKLENDKERSIGNPIRFSIPKNKVGIPHRSAKFPIIWGVGIDPIRDIYMFANDLGIIKTRGPYKAYEDETIGLGKDKALEALVNDEVLLDKIKKECYTLGGVEPKPYVKEAEKEVKDGGKKD